MAIPIKLEKIIDYFKDYSDLRYVDKGGYKIVYSGKIGDRKEAIKIFILPNKEEISAPEELKDDLIKESKKRIIRELFLLKQSKSPFIVKLGQIMPTEGEIDNKQVIYYSEEFLEGSNLANLIKNKYRPNKREIIELLLCLIDAVRELWHELNAVHRDIKPLNVIKTNNDKRPFVLLDLGIAFIINETPLTIDPGNRFPPGTTKYLAPEMLNPTFRGNLDFRSDLYTTGITVFEFAAGIHPLARDGDDLLATLSRIANEKPKKLIDLRPDLPIELCEVIDQFIKKMVALRPSNMGHLMKKIEEMK
jgi:serine/threonine protein kinase